MKRETLDDVIAWLTRDELGDVQRRTVARRLEDLSVVDVMRGLIEDVGAEDVLDVGALEGWWPAISEDVRKALSR